MDVTGDRPLRGARIVRAGHYDPDYSRNRIVAKALRRAGAEVVDIDVRRPFAARALTVARRLRAEPADLVMVPFPAHGDVPVARAARPRGVPLVFDPLVSLHDTMVEDRGLVRPGGLGACRYSLEDRWACRLADLVLLDTDAHVDWFVERYHLDPSRVRRVFVGADDDVVRPRPRPRDGAFRVFFYGTFIPLHGVEHVLDAVARLEPVVPELDVVVVGEGQTLPAARWQARDLGLTSVRFLGRRPFPELLDLMAGADVCLGVFGTTGKAARVVPNKVFDALAARRAVVTGDTPAAREALVPDVEARLCPVGDPDALAAAVRELRDDPARRERLAAAGHERFVRDYSIAGIAAVLAPMLADLMSRSGGRRTRPAGDGP